MVEHRQYNNPPIKEALIDIRVAVQKDVELENLSLLHEKIQEEFPVKKTMQEGQFSVLVDTASEQPPEAISKHRILGYRYESEDGGKVAQFRVNGLTYSRVGAYTSWEDMRDEAKKLWVLFLEAVPAETVTRIATRYINVLPVPLPFIDFSDYLTAPPEIPEELPQALSQFLTRVVVPNPDIGAIAVITQALENVKPDTAPIILDIDVFTEKSVDVDDSEYWVQLEKLRVFKNDIFFSSITENTDGLFK